MVASLGWRPLRAGNIETLASVFKDLRGRTVATCAVFGVSMAFGSVLAPPERDPLMISQSAESDIRAAAAIIRRHADED